MIKYKRTIGEVTYEFECDSIGQLIIFMDKIVMPKEKKKIKSKPIGGGFKVTLNDIISIGRSDNGTVKIERLDGFVMTFQQDDVTIEQ